MRIAAASTYAVPLIERFIGAVVPKVSSSSKGQSDLTPDLNKREERRAARLKRYLPDSYFQRIEEERLAGKPHKFTLKELKRIIKHVSNDAKPADIRATYKVDVKALEEESAKAKAFAERIAQERAEEKKSLLERIERRKALIDRITSAPRPTASYTAPAPVLLNFATLSNEAKANLLRNKLSATLTRLNALTDLGDHLENANAEHVRKLHSLISRLDALHNDIDFQAANAEHAHLRSTNWGLSAFKDISFKGLRSRFDQVLKEVVAVFDGGYFDWCEE